MMQVASLLDKYGEYIQGENDNNTKIIKEALDTHHQVGMHACRGQDRTEGWFVGLVGWLVGFLVGWLVACFFLLAASSLGTGRVGHSEARVSGLAILNTHTRRHPHKQIKQTQVVELLKKAGADETIKDKEGHTASDYGYKPASKDGEKEKEGEKAGKGEL